MEITKRFTETVINRIRDSILEAGGNEIFIVGNINKLGIVYQAIVAARGNINSVPALTPYMEKGDVIIHNHPSGELYPSSPDLKIASQLGNNGIGFYIINNHVDEIYVVAEPVLCKEIDKLNEEALASGLMPGGALEQHFPGYEDRPCQVNMLKFICRGFNEGNIVIAEAGTGVGKSLAYLIPAFEWAKKNKERIVISTATINLQQQLTEKDIPLVKHVFKYKESVVLVKGRGNYICLKRLEEALEEMSLFEEENAEIQAIKNWAQTSKTGSKSDLSFLPQDEVWRRVCSEADICHGLRCKNRSRCFILKARKEASMANILVVNHHLLFSDLAIRLQGIGFDKTAVLPPFHRIIFDEAHNIESCATSYFSDYFSRFTILRYLNRLFQKKKGRRFGLVLKLKKYVPESLKEQHKRLPEIIENIKGVAEQLNVHALSYMDEANHLLLDKREMDNFLKDFKNRFSELITEIMQLNKVLQNLFNLMTDEDLDPVFECQLVLNRLKGIAETANQFIRYIEDEEKIFWLEKIKTGRGEYFCRFIISPMDISPLMQEAVFKPYPTVVFTSATLTVTESFSYWKSRVGLYNEAREAVFPSPFNYNKNVLIGVPLDAPEPTEPVFSTYIADFIREVLEVSEGRALVLFTSYVLLREVYDSVQDHFIQLGYPVYRQGEDDRARLLNKFKSQTASILFATDSFWEGVDTPGEALEVLILCRLPFKVPTNPILKARTENIRKKGGNPFLQLSLPDAIMKLKQGFGRLIRRVDDKGVVLILDSRIVKKSYGRFFFDSLPDAKRKISEKRFLLEEVENFLVRIREKK
jgi:ATP-dependent DNA helicase DinG